jgi:hypothetical protein
MEAATEISIPYNSKESSMFSQEGRSVLEAPRMDPQSWPAELQDKKQKTHRTCVHRSEQQAGLESHKTAIKLHRSAQQNKTQECDGGPCVLCGSQE